MDWPAQLPDLNPIKHLWHNLKRRLETYPNAPRSINERWKRVQDEWIGIPLQTCLDLIDTMSRQVGTITAVRSGYTKY